MVNKHLHKICIIDFRPAFLNTDDPLVCAKLKSQKDAASAILDIFIMFFLETSRGDWNQANRIANQLTWPFIKTDNRTFRILRLLIKIQHIFHVPNEITRHLSYAPADLSQVLISFISIAFAHSCRRRNLHLHLNKLIFRSLRVHFGLPIWRLRTGKKG